MKFVTKTSSLAVNIHGISGINRDVSGGVYCMLSKTSAMAITVSTIDIDMPFDLI